jgi:hypothetical protein
MTTDPGRPIGDLLAAIVDAVAALGTPTVADIEIGAVEVKDGAADIRQTVLAASTAAQATDKAAVVALHPSSPLPVSTVSTASLSSLASAATNDQLLAANTSRKGLILCNTDANAVLIKYGTTASATSFTARIPGNYGQWEMPQPIYTGRIDAIWEADGSGSLYATEL